MAIGLAVFVDVPPPSGNGYGTDVDTQAGHLFLPERKTRTAVWMTSELTEHFAFENGPWCNLFKCIELTSQNVLKIFTFYLFLAQF